MKNSKKLLTVLGAVAALIGTTTSAMASIQPRGMIQEQWSEAVVPTYYAIVECYSKVSATSESIYLLDNSATPDFGVLATYTAKVGTGKKVNFSGTWQRVSERANFSSTHSY